MNDAFFPRLVKWLGLWMGISNVGLAGGNDFWFGQITNYFKIEELVGGFRKVQLKK